MWLRLPPVAGNQRALDTMAWQFAYLGCRSRSDRLYRVRPDQFVAASIPLRDNVVDEAHLRVALTTRQILHVGL